MKHASPVHPTSGASNLGCVQIGICVVFFILIMLSFLSDKRYLLCSYNHVINGITVERKNQGYIFVFKLNIFRS